MIVSELSLYARDAQADVIVLLACALWRRQQNFNPQTKVVLPDTGSTCSLVTMTDITKSKKWREEHADYVHVAYVNSSAEHKALADWIVTSRNVDDIIAHLYADGKR